MRKHSASAVPSCQLFPKLQSQVQQQSRSLNLQQVIADVRGGPKS